MEFLIAIFLAASLFLAVFPKWPLLGGFVILALAIYLIYRIYREAYMPTRRIDPDHLDNLLDGEPDVRKRIYAEPLIEYLDKRVFGQNKAKRIVASKLALRSPMEGRERPLAVFMLVGGTGVWKNLHC